MGMSNYNRRLFYRDAIANLGVRSTLTRGLKKRWGRSDRMALSSKYLDHPVAVRRDTTDLLVFDTIFVEREYSCLDGLTDVRTIVDAGGNCGYSSAYFLSRFRQARVIAVEPDADNFALMEANLAPWGDRIACVQAALWSRNTTLQFEDESTGAGNEWGRQTTEISASASVAVPAVDMPTLMDRYGIETIDLLKVDIEGAETELFAAKPAWLARVRNIVIELHGERCEAVVRGALADYTSDYSRSGELSVYLNLRPAA